MKNNQKRILLDIIYNLSWLHNVPPEIYIFGLGVYLYIGNSQGWI